MREIISNTENTMICKNEGFDLSDLLKDEFIEEYHTIKLNFEKYFEPWKSKMIHKRYRYKYDVFLPGSPFDLLPSLPTMSAITFATAFHSQMTSFPFSNPLYWYDISETVTKFYLDEYFKPVEEEGMLKLKNYGFLNAAAIALYPLLNYMGFKKVYFLGMDMSMFGSMEYAACYTFKSMRHFGLFFKKARRVFSYSFRPQWHNVLKLLLKLKIDLIPRKCFLRPTCEFDDMREIFEYKGMEFINVYEPFRYAIPVRVIRNITYKELIDQIS